MNVLKNNHLIYFMQYYKKQILAVCTVCMIGLIILFSSGFCKRAGDVYTRYTTYSGNEDNLDGCVKLACEMAEEIVTPDAEASSYLTVNISGNDMTVGNQSIPIGGVLTTVNQALSDLALVLLGTLWLVGLMNAILQQQNYPEVFVKRLFTLVIGIAVINYGLEIVFAVNGVGTYVFNKIVQSFQDADVNNISSIIVDVQNNIVSNCYREIDPTDNALAGHLANIKATASGLGFVAKLFFPWLINKVVNVVIIFTSWQRAMTIALMAVLSPIALMDVTNGHGAGFETAVRFAKNVLVVSLQGAIIYFGIMFTSYAVSGILAGVNSDFNDFVAKTTSVVAISLSQAGICLKSHSIAKEIIP